MQRALLGHGRLWWWSVKSGSRKAHRSYYLRSFSWRLQNNLGKGKVDIFLQSKPHPSRRGCRGMSCIAGGCYGAVIGKCLISHYLAWKAQENLFSSFLLIHCLFTDNPVCCSCKREACFSETAECLWKLGLNGAVSQIAWFSAFS